MSEKECILDIPVEHLENIFGQFDANIKLRFLASSTPVRIALNHSSERYLKGSL